MKELLTWIKKKKGISKVRKNIMFAGIAACVYQIWRTRNEALWNYKVWTVIRCLQNIRNDVYNRLYMCLPKKIITKDRECWASPTKEPNNIGLGWVTEEIEGVTRGYHNHPGGRETEHKSERRRTE